MPHPRELLSTDYLHPDPYNDRIINANYARAQFHRVIRGLRIDQPPLIQGAVQVLDTNREPLLAVDRWSNFKHSDNGTDMNSFSHSYRQATIAGVSASWDRVGHLKNTGQVAILTAASVIHDIGEGDPAIGDIPYPVKKANPHFYETRETAAAFEAIDRTPIDADTKDQLREAYWRTTTSLNWRDIKNLGWYKSTVFPKEMPWEQMHELFDLYEKYGYASTGIQHLGLMQAGDPIDPEDLFVLQHIGPRGQRDMLDYLNRRPNASQAARILCHYRTSGYPEITQAYDKGVQSAQVFVSEAEYIMKQAESRLKIEGLAALAAHRPLNPPPTAS